MKFCNKSGSTIIYHGCRRPLNKLPGHIQHYENVITNSQSNDTKKENT